LSAGRKQIRRHTRQPGFPALPDFYLNFHSDRLLGVFDQPEKGGNADGKIDFRDSIFSSLRIWVDRNHNGISEPDELHTLSSVGIESIDLHFYESRRVDEYGNQFPYRARINDASQADSISPLSAAANRYADNRRLGRWAVDVFLVEAH
jgi:hypothetical protein